MDLPTSIIPARRRVHRKRRAVATGGPSVVASVLQVRQVGEATSDAVWIFDTEVASIAPGTGTAGLHIDGLTLNGDFELLGGGFVLVSYHEIVPYGVAWHLVPASCHITFVNGAVLEAQDGTVVQWPPPPGTPTVVNVVVDTDGNTLYVAFDQNVTWDGVGAGTFTTSVGGGTWIEQSAPDALRMAAGEDVVFEIGADWSWSAPDSSLSPVPDDSQTGVCS